MRSWLSLPGLLRTLVSHGRLAWRLLREPRVPVSIKPLPVLAMLYVLSPLDVLPDVLPLLGQLDDLAIVVVALEAFLRLAPTSALVFHRQAIAERRRYAPMPPTGEIIDAEWRREA